MANQKETDRTQLPVELKINGQNITARPGQTVLQVVREQKLDDIPSLCDDSRLEPFGACFVCVVEVKGARGFVPSCTTRVRDGMEVTTRNERILYARKTALELLVSDHYADCLCPGQRACPAGVDVQGYLGLSKLGYYEEALKLIKERNPLPLVCGLVCVRKCEVNCRRKDVDEPVGINFVKRYDAEHSNRALIRPEVKPSTGKKVAVVGGGPAGLTCAYFLTLKGHKVKVFEAMPALGGMLRYGIPEYRLPKARLDDEISEIINLGVDVALEKKLGKDFTLDSLKKDGFDATFLTPGAPLGSKLGAPGEDVEGIESGLDFLRDCQLKGPAKLHGKVVVVGGGNSAVDAARTAMRCGADEVTILYRRTRKEMPAHHEEVDAADKEGVRLEMLAAPVEVLSANGRLTALRCIRMELGEPDASGRRKPVPLKGSEFDYPCDFVLAAIGQEIDKKLFNSDTEQARPTTNKRGAIQADMDTMATDKPGVFAGGDAVTGPAVVIDAIAHGRKAADAIHSYLTTGEIKKPESLFMSKRDVFGEIPERMYEDVERKPRSHLSERNPAECIKDFKLVESGLTRAEMEDEASRCMECGCKAQFDCDLRRYSTEYNVDLLRVAGQIRRHKVDNSHPLITIDPNKCILCGRCVRMCTDILGQPMLGFVGRGFTTTIKPALGRPLAESPCIACGACVETCPTGALVAKLPYGRQGPWKSKRVQSVCGFCSVACPLDLHVVTDRLMWASSPENSKPGEGDLCIKGRFGTGLIHSPDRLTKPLVRRGGELKETTWGEALTEAAKLLGDVRKKRGADAVAVMALPRMTLEECYLTGRLAMAALGTDQIGNFAQYARGGVRNDLDDILGETASTCFKEDINTADVVMVVGADPSQTHPVIGMTLRRAARTGAKIVVMNSSNIDLVRSSALWLDPRRGTMGILLAGVMRRLVDRGDVSESLLNAGENGQKQWKESLEKAEAEETTQVAGVLPTKIEELVDVLAGARNIVAIYDLDDTLERATDDLSILTQILMLTSHIGKPGSGLLLLQADSNAEGARIAGMREGRLPGDVAITNNEARRKVARLWNTNLDSMAGEKPESFMKRPYAGQIYGTLVMFNDPLCDPEAGRMLEGQEALVVVDHFLTETAKSAHVVLPAATLAESDGTVLSFDRKTRSLSPAASPQGGLSTAEVIARLSNALGHKIPNADAAKVRMEIASLLDIPADQIEKAREIGDTWPESAESPKFQRLRKILLSSRTSTPIRLIYASLDEYLQRRLTQMGMRM